MSGRSRTFVSQSKPGTLFSGIYTSLSVQARVTRGPSVAAAPEATVVATNEALAVARGAEWAESRGFAHLGFK